jgi:hypothetical protein
VSRCEMIKAVVAASEDESTRSRNATHAAYTLSQHASIFEVQSVNVRNVRGVPVTMRATYSHIIYERVLGCLLNRILHDNEAVANMTDIEPSSKSIFLGKNSGNNA